MNSYYKVEWMTQEFLKETFTYCESGNLIWRHDRPLSHFATKAGYNIYLTQRSDKVAGDSTPSAGRKYHCIQISMNGRKVSFDTHVLVYAYHVGIFPKIIEHLDGNTHNNRFSNLKSIEKKPKQRITQYNLDCLEANKKTYLNKYMFNSHGEQFQIIDYISNKEVTLKFLDSGFVCKTGLSNILRGKVNNPLTKTVCEVGCLGYRFFSGVPQEYKLHYQKWIDMIKRCYSGRELFDNNYSDVECSDYFLNFENFVNWVDSHKYYGDLSDNELEKDALNLDRSNRRYSEHTCALLPKDVNMFFRIKISAGKHGVSMHGKKYKAKGYSKEYIGVFDSEEDAEKAYKNSVLNKSKELYDKYFGLIDDRVLNILNNFEEHYDRFYKKK